MKRETHTQPLGESPEDPKDVSWLDTLDRVYIAVGERFDALGETLDAHPSGGLVGFVLLLLAIGVLLMMCVGLLLLSKYGIH